MQDIRQVSAILKTEKVLYIALYPELDLFGQKSITDAARGKSRATFELLLISLLHYLAKREVVRQLWRDDAENFW